MSQRKLFSKKQITGYLCSLLPDWEPTGIEHRQMGFFCDHPNDPDLMVEVTVDGTRGMMWALDGLLDVPLIFNKPSYTAVLSDYAGRAAAHTLPIYVNEIARSEPIRVGMPFRGGMRKQMMAANEHIPSFEDFLGIRSWIEMTDAAEDAWNILAENRDLEYPMIAAFAQRLLNFSLERTVVPYFSLVNTRFRHNTNKAIEDVRYWYYLNDCAIGIDAAMIYAGNNPFSTKQLDEPVEVPVILDPEIDSFIEGLLR